MNFKKTHYSKVSSRDKPLITIITAVYNCAEYIERAIQSVLNQTYENIEFIIIDGASNDGTVDIIQKYTSSIEYWVSEPDRGIYHAWNKALFKAKGQWVKFLGADDYFWSNNSINEIVPYLCGTYPPIRLVCGRVAIVTETGKMLHILGDEPWSIVKKSSTQIMKIPHPGVFHHRSLFECNGCFNEQFKIAGDFELLLRELKKQEAFIVPELIISAMQVGGVSSDPFQSLKMLKEMYVARRLNGFILPGRYWTLSLLKVCCRILLWQIIGEQKTRKILDLCRNTIGKPSYWTKT